MTGLVLKDFLCLRRVVGSMLLVAAFYFVLSFTAMFDLGIMAGVVMIILSFIPANCFAYDKAAGWDVYAATFPMSRARQVAARYLTVLLLMAAGLVLSLAMAGLGALFGKMDNWEVFLATDMVYTCMALIFNAIMLPLLYRFGAERSRVLFYGVLAAMALVGFLAIQAAGGLDALKELDGLPFSPLLAAGAPLVSLLLLGLSFPLSLHFYRKQEL